MVELDNYINNIKKDLMWTKEQKLVGTLWNIYDTYGFT